MMQEEGKELRLVKIELEAQSRSFQNAEKVISN